MFAPIEPRESAADACEVAIRRAILDGDLAPGERLPPERRLAESLGVTRVTLRSALTRLAAAGLLRVRQGSGYRVQDFRRRGGPDLLGGIAEIAAAAGRLPALVADLLLVRRHLARAVLERVAATPDLDIEPVVRAVTRFADAAVAGAPVDELADRDMDVLHALVTATGSPVLGLCLNPILAVVREMPALRQTIYGEPATNAAGYQLLVRWLERREPAQIEALVAELERRDARNVELLSGSRS